MAENNSALQKLAILFIKSYKKLVSPILGDNCRFIPSCSSYAIQAIERFGVIKGCWLSTKRILKCHPLNEGGEDPVPPIKKCKSGCSAK
jgi:hypothetical protein